MGEPTLQYREEPRAFPYDPPKTYEPEVMYVHRDKDGHLEAVDFLCPCGCGSPCWTPVTPMSEPKQEHHWQFESGPNGPTVHPSIRWTGGCKAHFTITDGKVEFHADSGK